MDAQRHQPAGRNLQFLCHQPCRSLQLGSYQVLVGNGYSSTNSYIATLNMSPTIISPFNGAITLWGIGRHLSVGAIGSGQLSYQWYLNGVAIDGATGATLNYSSIQFTNGGLIPWLSAAPMAHHKHGRPSRRQSRRGFHRILSRTHHHRRSRIFLYHSKFNQPRRMSIRGSRLTNLTLTQPIQIWVDTSVDASSPFNPMHFYRVLPGQ